MKTFAIRFADPEDIEREAFELLEFPANWTSRHGEVLAWIASASAYRQVAPWKNGAGIDESDVEPLVRWGLVRKTSDRGQRRYVTKLGRVVLDTHAIKMQMEKAQPILEGKQ